MNHQINHVKIWRLWILLLRFIATWHRVILSGISQRLDSGFQRCDNGFCFCKVRFQRSLLQWQVSSPDFASFGDCLMRNFRAFLQCELYVSSSLYSVLLYESVDSTYLMIPVYLPYSLAVSLLPSAFAIAVRFGCVFIVRVLVLILPQPGNLCWQMNLFTYCQILNCLSNQLFHLSLNKFD